MYSIGIYLMVIACAIMSLFKKQLRKQMHGQAKTLFKLSKEIKKDDKVVWFHCASLGEFEQGRLLMARVRHERPEYKILLTFFSPSGYEVQKDFEGADIVCYLPFDTPGNAASFLKIAHPEIGILIKYEFWANYIYIARLMHIKMYSVSSIFRKDQYFFRWYGNVGPLKHLTHLYVQNEESMSILEAHGIHNVTVVGDTRFDRVILVKKMSSNLPLVKTFCDGKKTFIVGSSWETDEEIYIPYMNKHRDWKLIIAPHKLTGHHMKSIEHMLEGRKVVYYSQFADNEFNREEGTLDNIDQQLKDADVFIIDFFGKLASIYRYADIAMVGGGFFPGGVHNVPEAAVYGVPVILGPVNEKYLEVQELKQCKGCVEVQDAEEFASHMDRLMTDEDYRRQVGDKAREYIYSKAGAVSKCYEAIFNNS